MRWYKYLIIGAVGLVTAVDVAATPAKANIYYRAYNFDRVQEMRHGQEWRRIQEIRRAQQRSRAQEIRRARADQQFHGQWHFIR